MSLRLEKICGLLQQKLALLGLDKSAADSAQPREEEIASELFKAVMDLGLTKVRDHEGFRESPEDHSSFDESDSYSTLDEHPKDDLKTKVDKIFKTLPEVPFPSRTPSLKKLRRELELLKCEEADLKESLEFATEEAKSCAEELETLEIEKEESAKELEDVRKQIKETEVKIKQHDPFGLYSHLKLPSLPLALSTKGTGSLLPDSKAKATESKANASSEKPSQACSRKDSRSAPEEQPRDKSSKEELPKSQETTRSSTATKTSDIHPSRAYSRPEDVVKNIFEARSVPSTLSYPSTASQSYQSLYPAQLYPRDFLPYTQLYTPSWGSSPGRPGSYPVPLPANRSSQQTPTYTVPNDHYQNYPAQYPESSAAYPAYWA